MNKKGLLTLALAIICAVTASAQSHKGLRISEVMVQNDSSLVDEYGNRNAWIELYNTTRKAMNFASVYITTERVAEGQTPDKAKMYLVPRGDDKTKVGHLQSAVFFADGQPGKGTLHTAITLTPGQENYIAIYDADGITKLDEVVVPANLPAGNSLARTVHVEDLNKIASNSFCPAEWEARDGSKLKPITPGEGNFIIGANDKVEQFREKDKAGIILTIMAMAIVFSALLLLCLIFLVFGKVNNNMAQKRAHKAEKRDEAPSGLNEEVAVAIAMALEQHLHAHDQESNILTFIDTPSDWASKAASLPEQPVRH